MAGALLRVVSTPGVPAVAAPFAEPELLEARVEQLESGTAPRPAALSRVRTTLTLAGALAFLSTVITAWTFVLLTCSCLLGSG